MSETIPNFGALLAPVLNRVDGRLRPRFLALLERTAADRYRMWADALPVHSGELMGCAASEDDIAARIERAFPIADTDLDGLRQLIPEARSIYYAVFDSLPVLEQLRLQAAAELQGAQAWRSIALGLSDPTVLTELARCSELEEISSAVVLQVLATFDATPSTAG